MNATNLARALGVLSFVSILLSPNAQANLAAQPTPESAPVQVIATIVTVEPGQTLWRIAVNNSLQDVTPWQMLMALYKTNPQAFRRGDIRQLLAHSRLTLPSLAQAQKLSAKQARAEYDELVKAKAKQPAKPAVKPTLQPSVKSVVKAASQTPVVSPQQVQLQQDLKQLHEQKSVLQSNMQSLDQEFEIAQINLGQVQAELEQMRSMLEQAQSNVLDARNAQLDSDAQISWLQGANTPRVLVFLLIPVVLVVGLIWWFIGRRKPPQAGAASMLDPSVVDEPPLALDSLAEYDTRRDATYHTELKSSSLPVQEQEQEQAQTQNQNSTIENGQRHLSSEVEALLKQRQPQAMADEPVEYLSPEEDINTKLDLAQSYCDMGQIAEARAVLQIVLNKGNAEQQTQAAQLLSRLNS